MTHMPDTITIQETKFAHKATTSKVQNFTTVSTDRSHKSWHGLITLATTKHSLQQTYLRLLIHTTQNFKRSGYTLTALNLSQLQTYIYLLEISHPRNPKQLTRTYNTSQTYHTQFSPEIWTHTPLHGHLYTNKHTWQLIADVISNSDHITLNITHQRECQTPYYKTSSPYITTVSTTIYNRTSWTTQ